MRYVGICILFLISLTAYSQSVAHELSLDKVLDTLSLRSPATAMQQLSCQNEILRFKNYKKGYLPSVSLSLSPISFNRSLRVLQNPIDGSYSYVEDYSNNSGVGITVSQKVLATGGQLSFNSSLNYLNEFSQKRSSFSSTPFSFGYSQQLFGGRKINKLEREIEYAKNELVVKDFCSSISQIQQQALGLYMQAMLSQMQVEFTRQTLARNDTLLQIGEAKLKGSHITEYEFRQIELQKLNAQYAYENALRKHNDTRRSLCAYLGIDFVENLAVQVPVFDLPLALETSVIEHYVQKNNTFVSRQQVQKLEAERTLFAAKLANRINSTISFNYGVNQYASNFADAYRRLNDRQSFVVGLTIPVFQWGIGRNNVKIAENNYKSSLLSIEQKKRSFHNEIREKVNNYNYSVKLWFTAEKAYRLSQEQYRMLVQKFALGRVSMYELNVAVQEQSTALQHYYSAVSDTYSNYFALRTLALYDFKQKQELVDILTNITPKK